MMLEAFRDLPFAPEVVTIPGGEFLMGAPVDDSEAAPIERPAHRVGVSAFSIGRYLVTFDEWDACADAGGAGGYRAPDDWARGSQPVINVSWDDAQAYLRWLSDVTGKTYRLPTEAEWEYAARAGTTTAYGAGPSLDQSQACYGWPDGAQPVGTYPANAFGLHDMAGNLWEWTQDCWNPTYQGAPADGRAWLAGDCSQRVSRGGAWVNGRTQLRSSYRFRSQIGLRSNSMGFRVVRELD